MKGTDGRKLSADELTLLRIRGVQAVQRGESVASVAKVLGVTQAAVFNWLSLYRKGGWDALNAKKRGGRPPKLDGKTIRRIYNAIIDKDPRQLKFEFALWTSRLIGKFIEKDFGIKLSKASICRLLNQLGLSPQRPLYRAWQQDPKRVEHWLKVEYPEIRMQANICGATIFFADEAGVRSDHHSGKTWSPIGKTPIIKTTGARFGVNIISAVSARGDMRFMLHKGTVTAKVFLEFLKRLVHNASKPVFLIVDGHSVHKSNMVKNFVTNTNGILRIFTLPPYSPELNPDELVWNDLKNNRIGRMVISGPDQLNRLVLSAMRSIQKNRAMIQSFFKSPDTSYASNF